MRAKECASRRTSSRCPAIDASASETTVAAPPIRFSAAPRSPPAISSATSAIRDSGATRTLPSTSTTTSPAANNPSATISTVVTWLRRAFRSLSSDSPTASVPAAPCLVRTTVLA